MSRERERERGENIQVGRWEKREERQTLFVYPGSLDDVGSLDLGLDERDVDYPVGSWLRLRLLEDGVWAGERPWQFGGYLGENAANEPLPCLPQDINQ